MIVYDHKILASMRPAPLCPDAMGMVVNLFIPCYIDQLYPRVGTATVAVLRRAGCEVRFDQRQTCCGQPMANSGDEVNSAPAEHLFVENFKEYDFIIGPAGSCVKQVRCHFDTIEQTADVKHVRQRTYELVEFLHDIVKADCFPWAEFQHSVAIHNSCSSIRGLGIAKPSEIMGVPFDKTANLLSTSALFAFQGAHPTDNNLAPPK